MKTYPMTRKEAWALSSLLKLPLQQGAVISEWLGQAEIPEAEEIEGWMPEVEQSLKVDEGLLESLMLAAVGQKRMDYSLRTSQGAEGIHYAIAGTGVVQYGFEGEKMVLHEVQGIEELLPKMIPEWLEVVEGEAVDIVMALGAFLMFRQACLQRDIAYLLNKDSSETFTRSELEEAFERDNGWVDVYHALGISGADRLADISAAEQIEQLIQKGLIEEAGSDHLQIGEAGKAMAQTLSNPNQISITLGFEGMKPERLVTGVFLAGAKRLMRLEFDKGMITITAVQSRQEGLDWIKSLVG